MLIIRNENVQPTVVRFVFTLVRFCKNVNGLNLVFLVGGLCSDSFCLLANSVDVLFGATVVEE